MKLGQLVDWLEINLKPVLRVQILVCLLSSNLDLIFFLRARAGSQLHKYNSEGKINQDFFF